MIKLFYKGVKTMKVKNNNIEYNMSKTMAQNYLKGNKKIDQNKFLCNIINEEFGLLGKCTKVHIIK